MYYYINEKCREIFLQGDQRFLRVNKKYPLYINKTAEDILNLCNGMNNLSDIIHKLNETYNTSEKEITEVVTEFIENMMNQTVVFTSNQKKFDCDLRYLGSRDFWTPNHITLELTKKCNLYCKHCYANAGNIQSKNIDNNLLSLITENILNLNISSVQLTGGEPTLHPHFGTILKKLVDRNIIVTVTTNGYLSIKDCYKFVPLINTDGYVQVSIDGTREYHDSLRGKKDSYEKALTTIKKLKNLGISVKIATCLISQSEDQIEELVSEMKNIGVNSIRLSPTYSIGRTASSSIDVRWKASNIKIFISKLNNKYKNNYFHVEEVDECENDINSLFKNCGAGYNSIVIDENGHVRDCLINENLMFNKNYSSLEEMLIEMYPNMLNNSKYISPSKDKCGNCEILSLCKGCRIMEKTHCKNLI